jgi:hypothetical protein
MRVTRQRARPILSSALPHYRSLAFPGARGLIAAAVAASQAILLDWPVHFP